MKKVDWKLVGTWAVVALLIIATIVVIAIWQTLADQKKVEIQRDRAGKIQVVTEMDNQGRRHGIETTYYEDGTISSTSVYEHGAVVRVVRYWPSGRIQQTVEEGQNFEMILKDFPDKD